MTNPDPARLIGLMAMFVSAVALAAPVCSRRSDGEVVKVEWVQVPVARDMVKALSSYPPCHGDRYFTAGAVEMECFLTSGRGVTRCTVISQQPADCAYGKMALQLARSFQAKSRTVDGRLVAVGMRVRIPVRFASVDGDVR